MSVPYFSLGNQQTYDEHDSLIPVTGVIEANHCSQWIYDEISDGHDEGYDEHLRSSPACRRHPDTCYCDTGGDVFIGDWNRSWEWRMPDGRAVQAHTSGSRRHRVWKPNRCGTNGYAALYSKDFYMIQVLWSEWVQHDARWCSPCYPNQASIGSKSGSVWCYILPPGLHRCFDCKKDPDGDLIYDEVDGRVRCPMCNEIAKKVREGRIETQGVVSQQLCDSEE